MRILLINHFPLTGSGSGTYTLNIAAQLIKKGHEAAIVMPENTTSFTAPDKAVVYPVYFTYQEPIENALPFNFPCFTTHPRSVQTFEGLDDTQLGAYMSAFESVIGKAVREFRPDVIHGQHIWLLSWLAFKTGIPCVVTAHGTDLMGYRQSARFRRYADEAAEGAKSVITISKDNGELVGEMFPACAGKAVFMRNGYDPERFYAEALNREAVLAEYGIRPTERVVLFSGKLAHFKGVDVLIEAAKLYGDGRTITLIAGDGELRDELKAQAAGLGNIHFLGFIAPEKLRKLYCIADVSVVPSRREPFGLVAIEALACGSPVVATNQGGLADIINDDIGALVDVDDARALADAVLAELSNPARAEKGRRAALYANENYAQDKLIDSLVGIYESISH